MPNKLTIDTTQNVILDIEKANIGDRLLAFVIDSLFITAYYLSMLLLLTTVFPLRFTEIFDGAILWWVFIVSIPATLYHLLFEWLKDGQSPGKTIMKIKVVPLDGGELTLGSVILRWVFRVIDLLPFLFGMVAIVSIAASKNAQRLGDMIAGTTVIKLKDRVKLEDTIYEVIDENYIPEFPEVTRLSNKDVQIIKKVLTSKEYRHNPIIANKLKIKIMSIMDVQSEIPPTDFLKKVLKDFNYYA